MPMSGEIEYGVVSFCPDLTDPAAPTVPVAVIGLLGEKSHANGEGNGKIFMIARADAEDLLPIEDDPLARAILNDLPDFLGEQVREGLRIAGASGLISWIEHSLRNSLHISNIQCSNVDMAVDPTFGTRLRRPRRIKSLVSLPQNSKNWDVSFFHV